MRYVYNRKAHYHETDQMGVIHHSNYIKWFEEARTAMMNTIGLPYRDMEEAGVICPVLSISVDYLAMVRFEDEVSVRLTVTSYTGIRFEVEYEVTDREGTKTHARGRSKHCFIGRDNKLLRLNRAKPDMHVKLKAAFSVDSRG